MPAPVLHLGANVRCSHNGVATPVAGFQRVLVFGQPIVTVATAYVITGCTLVGTPSPPCWALAYRRDPGDCGRRAGCHARRNICFRAGRHTDVACHRTNTRACKLNSPAAQYYSAGMRAGIGAIRLCAKRRCTTNTIKAAMVRQTARNSIGSRSLPLQSLIIGTTFCATKPPRLPTELIAAMPAAAVAPFKKVGGRLQNTGWPEKMPAAAIHSSANLIALPGMTTLRIRQAAPINAGMTICQVDS